MIEYIKGELVDATPAWVVVECNGLGYGINVSLNTYSAIQGKKEVKLYIYEAIREDAYVLYGFATRQERELFLLLISVSGIGGNTARMMSVNPFRLSVQVISMSCTPRAFKSVRTPIQNEELSDFPTHMPRTSFKPFCFKPTQR